MATAKPNKQTLSTADLRRDLDGVLADVASNEAQVVVEQDGKPLVAIIQPDELERLRRLEAEWEKPFAVIDRMRAAFADLSEEEIERDVADVLGRVKRRYSDADVSEVPQPTDEHGRTFWESATLRQLAHEQGVKPVQDVYELAGGFWPDDEGSDDFVNWLREQRRRG